VRVCNVTGKDGSCPPELRRHFSNGVLLKVHASVPQRTVVTKSARAVDVTKLDRTSAEEVETAPGRRNQRVESKVATRTKGMRVRWYDIWEYMISRTL
jgi:hypothetical protein